VGALQTAVLVVGIGILTIIAYGDVRTRRIPNALSLAIAILGLLRIILVHDPVAAGNTLAAGATIFVAAFVLF
jgi:Flp pilus assembly protein protease CpaA